MTPASSEKRIKATFKIILISILYLIALKSFAWDVPAATVQILCNKAAFLSSTYIFPMKKRTKKGARKHGRVKNGR